MRKKTSLILIVIALVYWLAPIDFVPDIIPLLGQADDLILGAIAVINFVHGLKANRLLEDNTDY
ncbi:MAG: DUF1232 domain-containing protein [Lachnospiraceae bacterium]|nr:DUF1232 domain-containing protein [Lachnospiraceae bacterium]